MQDQMFIGLREGQQDGIKEMFRIIIRRLRHKAAVNQRPTDDRPAVI